jgi:RNA polymerase sigma-70 factor (ECF subfamily)
VTQSARHLTEVLERESADLLRYFRRRVAPEDAADLLAETGMTAWRRADDLPSDREGARRWLFTVARNTFLNYQRGQQRRLALASRVRAVLTRAAHVSPSADDGIEVRDATSRLPPELAELVRLIHWDGFTIAEAAEVVGMSDTTARARYQRARAELRATLTATSNTRSSI